MERAVVSISAAAVSSDWTMVMTVWSKLSARACMASVFWAAALCLSSSCSVRRRSTASAFSLNTSTARVMPPTSSRRPVSVISTARLPVASASILPWSAESGWAMLRLISQPASASSASTAAPMALSTPSAFQKAASMSST